jgi:preprotein translocase subunit SecF
MTERESSPIGTAMTSAKRRRNLILGILLAAAALSMYVSIFFRLSVDPLK